MADASESSTGLGCLWVIALLVFVPAGFITAALWPDITANQFVGRTILIGLGCGAGVLVLGGAAALNRHRN